MKLQFFCPRWGSENIPWSDFLSQVKEAGYDGVEWAIAGNASTMMIRDIAEQIYALDLLLIPQHYDTSASDFEEHINNYSAWFEKVKGLPVTRVNSQTGKDFFTFEQNRTLINVANEFTRETGIPVFHETHRNKFSFAAHITKLYLTELSGLKITLDASHWVNVAESYLYDQPEAMQVAIDRTEHIHARIGYPEGPQVTDPRAPIWKEALDVHLAWWDRVVTRKVNEGKNSLLTITTEFGPFPYTVVLPFTNQPLASQWDINVAMMNMLRARYKGIPRVYSDAFTVESNF